MWNKEICKKDITLERVDGEREWRGEDYCGGFMGQAHRWHTLVHIPLVRTPSYDHA